MNHVFTLNSMRPVVLLEAAPPIVKIPTSVDVEQLALFEVEDAGCYLMYRSSIPCGFEKAVQQAEALMIAINE